MKFSDGQSEFSDTDHLYRQRHNLPKFLYSF